VVRAVPLRLGHRRDRLAPRSRGGGGRSHPAGRAPIAHEVEATGITAIEIAGDAGRLRAWLGPAGDALPILVVGGTPSVRAIDVGVAGGDPIRLV
jgi:hypothetical protein